LVSILSIVNKKNSESNYIDPTILNAIENYANRSIQLAESFVHLSRIESNEKIELFDLDLSDIIANAIGEVWSQAKIKNITIIEKLDRDNWFSANGSIIERVLVNLLINSIKYSANETSITITSGQKNDGLECCVEDNGIGILESDLETIFERFHRAKHQGNVRSKGLGLGLAFVRAAIERHNGTVSVKSILGKGSRFCFFIPFNKTERQ
jgi:signal transduction histidine kinase